MGVIIIIAVFWLLGLLMAWSMCVVAARADRRMEEIRHTHTDTDISRPVRQLHQPCRFETGRPVEYGQCHRHDMDVQR